MASSGCVSRHSARDAGKLDLALPLFEETLKLQKSKLGPEHPDTLRAMNNLASAYQADGKLDLALPLYEEALKLKKAKLGPEHPNTLITMNDLGAAYWSAKQFDKSVPLFEDLLRRREAKLGRDDPGTLHTVAQLGVNYKDAGRLEEALPLLEEAHRAAKKHARLRWVGMPLFDFYIKAGKVERAVAISRELLGDMRASLPKQSPQFSGQLARLAFSLLKINAFAEAEPLLRECLAIREETQPDSWLTFNTKSMLGAALLGQKKYADAVPLLLAGYKGMNERQEKIPAAGKTRLTEALQRLVGLYEVTGKEEEAAKWKAELAKRPAGEKTKPAKSETDPMTNQPPKSDPHP